MSDQDNSDNIPKFPPLSIAGSDRAPLSSSMQALPGAITMARLSYQWKQSEWCQGRPDLDPSLIGSSSLICVNRFRGDCFERCSKQRHTNVGFRHFSHKKLAPKIYFLVY